jgi:NitT/TauT family transport system permease protein
MTRARGIIWTRVAFIVAAVGFIELLCRLGVIKPLTMIAPSQMALELVRMMASGELTTPAAHTFMEVGIAFAVSVVAGAVLGALVHAHPRLRRALDPLLASWYAVPFFVFYPLLVALFGLNALPLIAIGVIFAAPAMMLSALAGLDRVPRVRKVARVHRLSWGAGNASHHLAERRAAFVHGAEAGLRIFIHRHHRRRVHPLRRRTRLRHRLCL